MKAQLRIHTEYSFGATYAPLDRVIERLVSIGCTHAAITDEASTWGHVLWHEKCRAAGIVPILGVELAVSDDETPTRMVLLARNAEGLKEIYRLNSLAHKQRIVAKYGSIPRLFVKDVVHRKNGVIALAGDQTDENIIIDCGALVDISPASRMLNMMKEKLAKFHGLPVVRTSDNAYAFPEDRATFEFINDRGLKPTPQHILDDFEVSVNTTNVFESYDLPKAPMLRAEGNLEALCRQGIIDRKMEWTQKYEDRLQYELNLIHSKDFDSYFLVVSDMMMYAKQHMLVGPSRGSSAGSLVCYLTRITEIDPLVHGLYFERFIDITRGGWKFNKDFQDKFHAI